MKRIIKLGNCIHEIIEKTTDSNQYPVLTSSQDGIVSQNEYFNKQVASKDNTGYKVIRRGQFTYRAMSDTGRFYINRLTCCDIGIVSPAYPVFELVSNSDALPEYIHAYFGSEAFQNDISLQSTGSTRVSLKISKINDICIQLPTIAEQTCLVNLLSEVKKLISANNQQLTKLDELVKSRFIEMFGTVSENPYAFPMVALKDVCHKITDGKHGGCEQESDSGYYYVGAREIYDGEIHYDSAPQITNADFAKDYKRCNIERGDMVIVNTGATIGKSAIAISPLTEHTLLQKSVALLKVKRECICAEFLRHCYMINPSMYMVESASAQPNLLLSRINVTKVYLPPIKLQQQFMDVVEQTDRLKSVVTQSLSHLETLKKSLMQKYFG